MIQSIRGEFLRYRDLAEGALAQVTDDELTFATEGSSSIAVICQHVAGNLKSRFTDFLTTDGEKPWRDRDTEFLPRIRTRDDLLREWGAGWNVLLGTLDSLSDVDLAKDVSIRRQPLKVSDALLRALAHVSYHTGQIVFVAKSLRGTRWVSLSIPPGQSAQYNASPDRERSPAMANSGARPSVEGTGFKPAGYTSAAPYLIVDGAERTIAFLIEVFGAREIRRFPSASGTLMHAEVQIDDTVVMLADGAPGWPSVNAHVHIYVRDVDAAYQRALAAGGVSLQEPSKKDDDDRRGGVRDAGGTTWWIATKVAGS